MLLGISLVLATLSSPAVGGSQDGQDQAGEARQEQVSREPRPYAAFYPNSSGFGVALAGGGDVDGDGISDFAAGSPWFHDGGPFTGRVEVFSGKDASVLHTFVGDSQRGLLGFSVCIPGDLNGDGKADIVAGAPFACRVLVWSGTDGSLIRRIHPHDGFGDSWFGAAIAALGDIDADGVTDLAIGAPQHKFQHWGGGGDGGSEPDPLDCGRVYLVSGRTGGTIRTLGSKLSNSVDELFTQRFASNFGRSLCGMDDVDGDGIPDLAVGAPGEPFLWFYGRATFYLSTITSMSPETFHRPQALHYELVYPYRQWRNEDGWFEAGVGRVYVFSGRDGSLLRTLSSGGTQDGFGCALAAVGDVDHDGRCDLAVGAYRDVSDSGHHGSVRIFGGADGEQLLVVRGRGTDSEFGYALAAAGDVDGDGFPDLWVDDPVHDNRPTLQGNETRGEVRLVSGRDGSDRSHLSRMPGWGAIHDYGLALATLDDLDGDGVRDLLLGVPDTFDEGCAYVVSSRTGRDLLEIDREDEDPAGRAPPEEH